MLQSQLSAQIVAESPTFLDRTDFMMGYYGNLGDTHGINLGAEYLWKEKVKIKQKKKKDKTIKHQLLLNASLGYSTNFATKTQNGIFAFSGLILRRVGNKDFSVFATLNPLGLYRSVLPTTYKVEAGNEANRVFFPGRSYYAPSIAIGIERFRKKTKRLGWYLNFQYAAIFNYNTGELDLPSINFGGKFNLSK